ncbi:flavin reductase family protein [Georgenia sp. SYP-B2076]|uniref:flavin reductase family protein n=1 Tax=Georgenia sp. SYP-B2076 TaxID=2495881 RepID=UPI000F8D163B|nr:flavin reductase family protein [Georgenia sp. SYP-B2076]
MTPRTFASPSGAGVSQNLTPRNGDGLSPDEFKAAFRNHPAGVALITADDGERPVALTATSVISVSAVPPMLVFSVTEFSSSAPVLRAADTVVVHLLGAEQLDLAKLGATSGIDRFADTTLWSRLPTGEPFFPSASVWIRGRVVEKVIVGNSIVFVVQGLEAKIGDSDVDAAERESSVPLVYHNRTWHHLGQGSRVE